MISAVARLGGELDLRAVVLERLPAQRARVALEVAALPLVPLLDLGADGVEPHREPAGHERLVHIERITLRAEIVVAHLHLGLAAKGRALARDVDDAAGIDVAVGEPAGPAAELDALGVVNVGDEIPREAVAELAHGREAADVDLIARALADDGADGAEVVGDVLGIRREADGVEIIVERHVLQKFLRHHRDRVGQVGEFLVGARARHRGGGGVADILVVVDLEHRERERLVRGGSRGARGNGWLGLRGQDHGSGKKREGEPGLKISVVGEMREFHGGEAEQETWRSARPWAQGKRRETKRLHLTHSARGRKPALSEKNSGGGVRNPPRP